MVRHIMLQIAAVAILTSVLPAAGRAASVQPLKGAYELDGFITAVTAQGGATTCPSVGSTLTWTFNYPGPAKAGATAYGSGVKQGNFKIAKRIFPTTPAAGATSWGGNITEDFSNGDNDTATFSTTTWQYFDSSTLLLTMSLTEPQTVGSCVETIQMTFIKL